jgi:tetratricopeptide (TPR) repeat protein
MTKKMSPMRAVSIAAALAGCVWSGHANAQEAAAATAPQDTMAESTAREADLTDQQARAHYTVGVAMYDAGRFPEAATEFQAAYDLSHRPQLLYNCYVAYRDSSQPRRARDSLRQFLMEVPDAPNRIHLQARLEAMDAEIAAIDDAAAQQEAQRQAAEQAARDAMVAQQAAEADARLARQRQRPWWPWVFTGAGLALTGVGIGIAVDAGNQAEALRRSCTDPVTGMLSCPTAPQLVRPLDRAPAIQTQAAIADALWVAGVASAAAGLILTFALDDDEPSAPTASGSCSPTGCEVHVQGTF